MKIYKVKVNGKVYEVELEAVSETSNHIVEESKPQTKPSSTEGVVVNAPIGGKVVDVLVKENQTVKKGDKLLIIEAMKLENEVVSPQDGVVKEIKIAKGAVVNTKDALVVIG